MPIATPAARRARYRVQALDYATGVGAAAAALALLERGGVAHLSLARTADELFALPAPNGSPLRLDVPLTELASPYGMLRQVHPIIGEPASPSEYGGRPSPGLSTRTAPVSPTGRFSTVRSTPK